MIARLLILVMTGITLACCCSTGKPGGKTAEEVGEEVTSEAGQQEKEEAAEPEQPEMKDLTEPGFANIYRGQALVDSDWMPDGTWRVKDGVLTGSAGPGEIATLSYEKSSEWQDFVLRIRMRLVKGALVLGVRGTEVTPLMFRYDPIVLAGDAFNQGEWYTVNVNVQGTKYTVTAEPPLKTELEVNAQKEKGPIAFFLRGNSEVQIEWANFKLLEEKSGKR